MSAELTPARAASPARACRGASLVPLANNGAAVARATICLINRERARHHLGRVRANAALARIALGQSVDMVRGDYFADHSLGGLSPLERIVPALEPARVAAAGQNIGWGAGVDARPEAIVSAWMQSPPHRRVVLGAAFGQAGVGVAPALPVVLEQGTLGATYTLDVTALARHAQAAGR
ncbi:MAG TPA: CAP domain-containing protein [Usitatibacter sp.]|nr:CAP domain-containing protein [Usitatibacter sp.]